MNLIEALKPELPARVAIVGAGGKTTSLFQLANQVDGLAWVTTTTHFGTDQLDLADRHFFVNTIEELEIEQYKNQKVTLITGPYTKDNRVNGPVSEILEKLTKIADKEKISLFIEADGARSFPVKAPAEHEPAIPLWVDHVIVVVGLSVLGKPFNHQWVHRPEYFARITHLKEGEIITIESVGDMLVHPAGGLKNIPIQAQKVALINQADNVEILAEARKVVPKLLDGGFDKVIIGSLRKAPHALERYSRV
ncbi:MAG: hypothetical protein FD147_499 [Chloroflexi bacterium]|nr:MAG: hypothetical protein FD147_499 [Chloroflexota bacterium]